MTGGRIEDTPSSSHVGTTERDRLSSRWTHHSESQSISDEENRATSSAIQSPIRSHQEATSRYVPATLRSGRQTSPPQGPMTTSTRNTRIDHAMLVRSTTEHSYENLTRQNLAALCLERSRSALPVHPSRSLLAHPQWGHPASLRRLARPAKPVGTIPRTVDWRSESSMRLLVRADGAYSHAVRRPARCRNPTTYCSESDRLPVGGSVERAVPPLLG